MSAEGRSGRAAGGQLEERLDLSHETNEKIDQAKAMVQASPSNLSEALTLLAALEKRCRVGNDNPSLVRVCETSLVLCHESGDHEALVSTLKSLATRRSQKSQAVSKLVHTALPWVLQTDESGSVVGIGAPIEVSTDDERQKREKLMVALRDITDGKLFLEAERARLTRGLAAIKEDEGDLAGAADCLQEVHVETYGSLSKREKVEFILEQMRLTLAKKDYIRSHIVSNKINRKVLSEEGMDQEKIKFFKLLSEYHRHEKDAFQLAQDYHQIYLTPCVQKDEAQWKEALQSTVLFLALSPFSMEQQDMLNRINLDSNLEKIEPFRSTISILLKKEVAPYPIPYQSEIESISSFQESELAMHWKSTLHIRINQHNIRVVSKYYRRIHGARLAELLGLTLAELEMTISDMVSDGSVYAKIDRPNDIVRFAASKSPEAILTEWAGDISQLLDLVEKTTHLIHKEMTAQ